MRRTELIKKFKQHGWEFEREGGKHTILRKENDTEAIPRHKEINEKLAKALIKKWDLK